MMGKMYRVAGYVKLAKLWEKSREKAIELHNSFFEERYRDTPDMKLIGVYVDITGNKNTYKRPEMVRLINDCRLGRIDVIVMQTRAYFVANSEELCFLLKYLFTLPYKIDIVTDDEEGRIDTILNVENQRESLLEMAEKYSSIKQNDYEDWKKKLETAMDKLASE